MPHLLLNLLLEHQVACLATRMPNRLLLLVAYSARPHNQLLNNQAVCLDRQHSSRLNSLVVFSAQHLNHQHSRQGVCLVLVPTPTPLNPARPVVFLETRHLNRRADYLAVPLQQPRLNLPKAELRLEQAVCLEEEAYLDKRNRTNNLSNSQEVFSGRQQLQISRRQVVCSAPHLSSPANLVKAQPNNPIR